MDSYRSLSRFLGATFVRGLALVIPVAGAAYVLTWLLRDSEGAIRSLLLNVIPRSMYFPGLGIGVFVVLTFLLGLLMYPWLTRVLIKRADTLFRNIPLFSQIYSPLKDLFDMFGGDMSDKLGTPVMVTIPGTQMQTLGFITRKSADGLPEGMLADDHVVVYVQWSSQVGGYCFIVPEDSLRPLDMSVEEGMRWALTAGLSGPGERS